MGVFRTRVETVKCTMVCVYLMAYPIRIHLFLPLLFIYLFVHLFIHSFIHLFIYLFINLFIFYILLNCMKQQLLICSCFCVRVGRCFLMHGFVIWDTVLFCQTSFFQHLIWFVLVLCLWISSSVSCFVLFFEGLIICFIAIMIICVACFN